MNEIKVASKATYVKIFPVVLCVVMKMNVRTNKTTVTLQSRTAAIQMDHTTVTV